MDKSARVVVPWTTAHLPDIFNSNRPLLAEAAWQR
jgi:hypothetical protein